MTTPPDGAAGRPGNSSRSVRFRTEIGLTRPEPSDRSDAGEPVEHWDALVVGGGIAGLTAAWELARAGLRPLLVEARGYTGGLVAAGAIAGVRLPSR